MTGWHLGELLAFDLETTAPEPTEARIVTACTARVNGSVAGFSLVKAWLVDPGVDIPEEAAAIHGITTEQARAEGADPAVALPEITQYLYDAWAAGSPVIGHNVSYDLTVLAYERARHGLAPFEVRGPVVDTFVLDKHVDKYRRGSRTLTVTAGHYRVALDGAHDATFDALASARIAWRICQRFPQIAGMSLAQLHDAQVGWAAEQAAGLQDYFRRTDPAAIVDGTWPVRALPAAVAS
jgi:DNA polymerase III epsilon subunit-like protein